MKNTGVICIKMTHLGSIFEYCQDLIKMSDVTRRIQLQKGNVVCLLCCRDHRVVDCRKQDRVCGNGKVNRGCPQQHKMHELFCPTAKRTFPIWMSILSGS